MEEKNEVKIVQPDYKTIRELSHCMDCTVEEADFNTLYPNPDRISYIASDIHRHLKYKRKTEWQ